MTSFAILISIFALLAIISTRVAGASKQQPWRLVFAFIMAGTVSTLALRHLLVNAGWVPDTEVSRLIKYVAPRLDAALADPSTSLVILLNGSSLSHRGVDGRRLEDALSERLRVRVAVAQLSIPGSNHLERDLILRRLTKALSANGKKKLATMPVLVLWEVHQGYDANPLAHFDRNQGTARAFDHLDVRNGFYWARLVAQTSASARKDALIWAPEVVRHMAISAAGVGAFEWHTPRSDLIELEGFVQARQRLVPKVADLAHNVEKMKLEPEQVIPAYVDTHLIPRYLARLASQRKSVIFFSPPTRVVWQMAYVNQFCEQRPLSVCVGFANRNLLRSLDDRRYWFDGSHLSVEGAVVYTDWLAPVLASAITRHQLARMPRRSLQSMPQQKEVAVSR